MDGGAGYTSRGGLSSRPRQDHVQISIGRHENEEQLSALRQDVAKLKQLAYAIDDERKLQGADINSLEDAMERARAAMSTAMRRLKVVTKQSRSWLVVYVFLFVAGWFLFVVFLSKLHRLGRLFFWR